MCSSTSTIPPPHAPPCLLLLSSSADVLPADVVVSTIKGFLDRQSQGRLSACSWRLWSLFGELRLHILTVAWWVEKGWRTANSNECPILRLAKRVSHLVFVALSHGVGDNNRDNDSDSDSDSDSHVCHVSAGIDDPCNTQHSAEFRLFISPYERLTRMSIRYWRELKQTVVELLKETSYGIRTLVFEGGVGMIGWESPTWRVVNGVDLLSVCLLVEMFDHLNEQQRGKKETSKSVGLVCFKDFVVRLKQARKVTELYSSFGRSKRMSDMDYDNLYLSTVLNGTSFVT
eukprot:GHVS01014453.1.p1 GENE.GHVS01014453.1~~GHVS01014453.1.p1  ORF type:complete len:287 (+),score=39.47 GHVS01014453.1:70-930(+)